MPLLIVAFIVLSSISSAQVQLVQEWQVTAGSSKLYGIAAINSQLYHAQNHTTAFLINNPNANTITTSVVALASASCIVPRTDGGRSVLGAHLQNSDVLFDNNAWLIWKDLNSVIPFDSTLCTIDVPIDGFINGTYSHVVGFGKYISELQRAVTWSHINGIVTVDQQAIEISTNRTILFKEQGSEFSALAKEKESNGYYAGNGYITTHTPQFFPAKIINAHTGVSQTVPEKRTDYGYSTASVVINDSVLLTNLGVFGIQSDTDTLRIWEQRKIDLGVPIRILHLPI